MSIKPLGINKKNLRSIQMHVRKPKQFSYPIGSFERRDGEDGLQHEGSGDHREEELTGCPADVYIVSRDW